MTEDTKKKYDARHAFIRKERQGERREALRVARMIARRRDADLQEISERNELLSQLWISALSAEHQRCVEDAYALSRAIDKLKQASPPPAEARPTTRRAGSAGKQRAA